MALGGAFHPKCGSMRIFVFADLSDGSRRRLLRPAAVSVAVGDEHFRVVICFPMIDHLGSFADWAVISTGYCVRSFSDQMDNLNA